MFIHLHNHSDFSLLDGACKIPDLVQCAVDQGASAIALTDHGNMFGALDFYTQAKKNGIKPIVGCELYMTSGSRFTKKPGRSEDVRYHQIVIAKNLIGYHNLIKLTSEAYTTGFYYKPRIDKELLKKYSEGLICLSSCLQGEVPQLLVNGHIDKARDAAQFYKDIFGDDFYIELHRHGIDEQEKIIPDLAQIAEDLELKLVATNDAHYIKREHASAHDLLLCIQTGALQQDQKRLRFKGEEFYLKSESEMSELFGEFPQALETTLEIADKCDLEIDLTKRYFPIYTLPEDLSDISTDEYLAQLVEEGYKNRYGDSPPDDAHDRILNELEVISSTGFSNYFLIVWDFVRWAKEHDIPVGPGRGSAAGCLVSYCLEITNIDPIRYGLIFERFLNPERVTPPDIDIDFADDRREEVIAYVRERYGSDCVCRITTFGKMAAKSAVRDVARVLGMAYADGDKVAKLIPFAVGGKDVPLDQIMRETPDLKKLINSDDRFKNLMDHARVIQGSARHASTHAAGVVITPGPTDEFVPVYTQSDDDEVYTQYDMNWVDTAGLLKMDFLGLQTLTELDLTIKSLKKRGIEVDLDEIDLDDRDVFKLFSEGKTTGIFQFESSGMRDNLMKLQPRRVDDLIAMNALYRPGPMQKIGEFIDCSHGDKKAAYLHEKLEPILNDTHGVIVYQEQVIKIATDLAGFSLGKADNLRWAMGKKKMHLMKSLKKDFIEGCASNGIDKKIGVLIYEVCEQFAKYGFVKAHSAGYAVIAYQCAWLKVHHTADYLAACLTVRTGKPEQMIKLLSACQESRIPVLSPDINESETGFVATPKGIRFGLSAVKNVGEAAVKSILEARQNEVQFTSLYHFLSSVDLRTINKRVIESLIYAGAFNSLGANRATLMNSLPSLTAYAQALQDDKLRGQATLFGGSGDESTVFLPPPETDAIDEWAPDVIQKHEKEILGHYISSHPLERFELEIVGFSKYKLTDKDSFKHELYLQLCAVVNSVHEFTTLKGAKMAYVTVEDLTGTISCLVFPSTYAEYKDLLVPDILVGVSGHITREDENEEVKLKIEEVIPLTEVVDRWGHSVRIRMPQENITEQLIDRLERMLEGHPGNAPLYIEVLQKDGPPKIFKVGKYKVRPSALIDSLSKLVGYDQVMIGP